MGMKLSAVLGDNLEKEFGHHLYSVSIGLIQILPTNTILHRAGQRSTNHGKVRSYNHFSSYLK